jgi:hypothetical protein
MAQNIGKCFLRVLDINLATFYCQVVEINARWGKGVHQKVAPATKDFGATCPLHW